MTINADMFSQYYRIDILTNNAIYSYLARGHIPFEILDVMRGAANEEGGKLIEFLTILLFCSNVHAAGATYSGSAVSLFGPHVRTRLRGHGGKVQYSPHRLLVMVGPTIHEK